MPLLLLECSHERMWSAGAAWPPGNDEVKSNVGAGLGGGCVDVCPASDREIQSVLTGA